MLAGRNHHGLKYHETILSVHHSMIVVRWGRTQGETAASAGALALPLVLAAVAVPLVFLGRALLLGPLLFLALALLCLLLFPLLPLSLLHPTATAVRTRLLRCQPDPSSLTPQHPARDSTNGNFKIAHNFVWLSVHHCQLQHWAFDEKHDTMAATCAMPSPAFCEKQRNQVERATIPRRTAEARRTCRSECSSSLCSRSVEQLQQFSGVLLDKREHS